MLPRPGSGVSLPRSSSLRRSFLLASLRGLHLLRSLRPVARDGSRIEPTKGSTQCQQRISSAYVETFWLIRRGPSAVCLLRLFDRLCRHQPNHQARLSAPELGTMIGTPGSATKNSVITTRIDRLTRLGAARWDTEDHAELMVWSHRDAVPLRLQSRWPDWLTNAPPGQSPRGRPGDSAPKLELTTHGHPPQRPLRVA